MRHTMKSAWQTKTGRMKYLLQAFSLRYDARLYDAALSSGVSIRKERNSCPTGQTRLARRTENHGGKGPSSAAAPRRTERPVHTEMSIRRSSGAGLLVAPVAFLV